jgi:hypothetical protein
MTNRTKLVCLILVGLFLLMMQPSRAQLPPIHVIRKGTVLIINDSNKSVTFNLRNGGDSDWVTFTLPAHNHNTYNRATEILIITNGKGQVHYGLRDAQRHRIFWNEKRGLWDMVWMQPGN